MSFIHSLGKYCALLLLAVMLLASRARGDAVSVAVISNFSDDNISLVDTVTNTVGGPISVGHQPRGLAISPDGSRAYVTSGDDNALTVIDLTTTPAAVTATITLPSGSYPIALAITPTGERAYVANNHGGNVMELDLVNNVPVGEAIPVAIPGELAITPDGSRAYVPSFSGNEVIVIHTATNTISGSIGVGAGPQAVAITPDGKRVYVTNGFSNTVSVIDTASQTVLGAPILVGVSPYGIAVTPDGTRAYVTNTLSHTVSVIDTATNTVLGAPIAVGIAPSHIAITPDGRYAYVTSSSGVWVIETSTNTTLSFSLPSPYGIAVTPPRPFSATTAQYLVTLNPSPSATTFKVTMPFTLGAGNDGIHPLIENVFFQIGQRFATFPAGSFHLTSQGTFKATRIIDDTLISAVITPLGGDQFKAVLSGDLNPETVQLKFIVGNDGGNLVP